MVKIRKGFNAKIVAVFISMVFLCNSTLYACPFAEDRLRLHIGDRAQDKKGTPDDTYHRMLSHAEHEAQRDQPDDDINLSAEGDVAVHEAPKIGFNISQTRDAQLYNRSEMTYALKDGTSPGVNDIIRELRSMEERTGEVGFENLSMLERAEMISKLRDLDYGDVAERLQYRRICVYDIEKSNLASEEAKEKGGFVVGKDGEVVTTHFGIRTGTIHITKKELERVGLLGLAARMGHEAQELDRWLNKAEKLKEDGEIASIGSFAEEYSEDWEDVIRQWIRENLQDARKLDRQIHGEGLKLEMEILIKHLEKTDSIPEMEVLSKIIDQGLDEEAISLQHQEFYKCITHFRSTKHRETFIEMLVAKVSGKDTNEISMPYDPIQDPNDIVLSARDSVNRETADSEVGREVTETGVSSKTTSLGSDPETGNEPSVGDFEAQEGTEGESVRTGVAAQLSQAASKEEPLRGAARQTGSIEPLQVFITNAINSAEDTYIKEAQKIVPEYTHSFVLRNVVETSLENRTFLSICQDVRDRVDRIETEEELIEAANKVLLNSSDARIAGVGFITDEISTIDIVSIFGNSFQPLVTALAFAIKNPGAFVANRANIANDLYDAIVLTSVWRQTHISTKVTAIRNQDYAQGESDLSRLVITVNSLIDELDIAGVERLPDNATSEQLTQVRLQLLDVYPQQVEVRTAFAEAGYSLHKNWVSYAYPIMRMHQEGMGSATHTPYTLPIDMKALDGEFDCWVFHEGDLFGANTTHGFDPYVEGRVGGYLLNRFLSERDYRHVHDGLDFAWYRTSNGEIRSSTVGMPVKLPREGTVYYARDSVQLVIVRHSDTEFSLSAHIERCPYQEGDSVQEDDVIGYLAEHGLGSHLHFSLLRCPLEYIDGLIAYFEERDDDRGEYMSDLAVIGLKDHYLTGVKQGYFLDPLAELFIRSNNRPFIIGIDEIRRLGFFPHNTLMRTLLQAPSARSRLLSPKDILPSLRHIERRVVDGKVIMKFQPSVPVVRDSLSFPLDDIYVRPVGEIPEGRVWRAIPQPEKGEIQEVQWSRSNAVQVGNRTRFVEILAHHFIQSGAAVELGNVYQRRVSESKKIIDKAFLKLGEHLDKIIWCVLTNGKRALPTIEAIEALDVDEVLSHDTERGDVVYPISLDERIRGLAFTMVAQALNDGQSRLSELLRNRVVVTDIDEEGFVKDVQYARSATLTRFFDIDSLDTMYYYLAEAVYELAEVEGYMPLSEVLHELSDRDWVGDLGEAEDLTDVDPGDQKSDIPVRFAVLQAAAGVGVENTDNFLRTIEALLEQGMPVTVVEMEEGAMKRLLDAITVERYKDLRKRGVLFSILTPEAKVRLVGEMESYRGNVTTSQFGNIQYFSVDETVRNAQQIYEDIQTGA